MVIAFLFTLSFSVGLFGVRDAYSETIWCKTLGLGCKSIEEKKKDLLRCQRLANSTYNSTFSEALSDPSVWQLGGYENAQDYANKRRLGMYSICINY